MMTYQSDTRYCIKTIEPPYTERYVRWCERTMGEIITHFLLDSGSLSCPICWFAAENDFDFVRIENRADGNPLESGNRVVKLIPFFNPSADALVSLAIGSDNHYADLLPL